VKEYNEKVEYIHLNPVKERPQRNAKGAYLCATPSGRRRGNDIKSNVVVTREISNLGWAKLG
jgi:hypothetical protein